jgi:hypothetical protein
MSSRPAPPAAIASSTLRRTIDTAGGYCFFDVATYYSGRVSGRPSERQIRGGVYYYDNVTWWLAGSPGTFTWQLEPSPAFAQMALQNSELAAVGSRAMAFQVYLYNAKGQVGSSIWTSNFTTNGSCPAASTSTPISTFP